MRSADLLRAMWRKRGPGRASIRSALKVALRYWHFRLRVRFLRLAFWDAAERGFEPATSPLITILIVAYRTRPAWLREAVDSVRQQTFGNWELRIGLCEVAQGLRREMEDAGRIDRRIRLVDLSANAGISANTNAVAEGAEGEYLAVLDHDDILEPHALAEVRPFLVTGYDLVYTDEDLVTAKLGIPFFPHFKPDWSPESLLSYNYICHFCCFRRRLFEEMGGLRPSYDNAQDYDLFLRLTERTNRIAHVPKVLYHWRRHKLSSLTGSEAKLSAHEVGKRALQCSLDQRGEGGTAEDGGFFATYRARYPAARLAAVEMIILARGPVREWEPALREMLRATSWSALEVTVVTDDVQARLASFHRPVHVVVTEAGFDRAKMANQCAQESVATVLVFLEPGMIPQTSDWLEALVEQAHRDGIAAAGPMLTSPEGRLLHAGMGLVDDGSETDLYVSMTRHFGYPFRLGTIQNVTAVCGAGLCARRDAFLLSGGFPQGVSWREAGRAYCLESATRGMRTVYTPYARLSWQENGQDSYPPLARKAGPEQLDRHFNAPMFAPQAGMAALAAKYLASPALIPPGGIEGRSDPRIACIVLHYRNIQDTNACLASLGSSGIQGWKIFLVNNDVGGRADPMLRKGLEGIGRGHAIITPGYNSGFAGGCNLGMRAALDEGFTHIVLLNNDTIVAADFTRAVTKAVRSHPEVVLAGEITDENGLPTHNIGSLSPWTGRVRHNLDRRPPQGVNFVSGCLMIVPRDVLERVGLFDEKLFMYCEDMDLCQRFRRAAVRVRFESSIRVTHKFSPATSRSGTPKEYYIQRNQTYLILRRGTNLQKVLYIAYLLVLPFYKAVCRPRLLGQALSGAWDGLWGRLGRLP